jgi:hypothetical protein
VVGEVRLGRRNRVANVRLRDLLRRALRELVRDALDGDRPYDLSRRRRAEEELSAREPEPGEAADPDDWIGSMKNDYPRGGRPCHWLTP